MNHVAPAQCEDSGERLLVAYGVGSYSNPAPFSCVSPSAWGQLLLCVGQGLPAGGGQCRDPGEAALPRGNLVGSSLLIRAPYELFFFFLPAIRKSGFPPIHPYILDLFSNDFFPKSFSNICSFLLKVK